MTKSMYSCVGLWLGSGELPMQASANTLKMY